MSEEEYEDIDAAVEYLFEYLHVNDTVKVAGPEVGPNADALTSLTRGRGPRRGNLEDLLKYWRPIMKKPGGFRRCVVILMDKPQFAGKPQRICAWLHHEITGKWPNEGKGKKKRPGGKRRGKRTGSVRRAGKRGKSVFEVPSRESVLFSALDGSEGLVEFKTGAFLNLDVKKGIVPNVIKTPQELGVLGTAATSGLSFLAPGDLSDIRSPVRSAIFEALTPGLPGGGRGGRRRLGLPGRARNQFRCPPGFEQGGTFTNSNFSTCGLRVLGIPSWGPGSLGPGVSDAIRKMAEDSDLVRSIGDIRDNRNSVAIIENSQIPSAPKEVSIGKRQNSIDFIVGSIEADPSLDFDGRVVRRDGIILEMSVPKPTLVGLGEFDDLNDGVLVYSDGHRTADQIGQDVVPLFSSGIRAVLFHVPGEGSISLRRTGGDMTEDERRGLNASWAASLSSSSSRRPDDPTAALRNFVENSDGRFVIDENISGSTDSADATVDRELIVVESSEGRKMTVPRWVFRLYLSREAPRRSEDDTMYAEVDGEVDAKAAELSRFALVDYQVPVVDAADIKQRVEVGSIESRVDAFRLQAGEKGIGGKAGRAVPDPSGKFRCPAGTGGGGQFTDANATTCGARLAAGLIEKLYRTGRGLGIPDHEIGRGRKRRRAVAGGAEPSAVSALVAAPMERSFKAIDAVRASVGNARDLGHERYGGSLGATVGDLTSARGELLPRDEYILDGALLLDALHELGESMNFPLFLNNADDELLLDVFTTFEELSSVEAARRGVRPSSTGELGTQAQFDRVLGEGLDTVHRLAGENRGVTDISPEEVGSVLEGSRRRLADDNVRGDPVLDFLLAEVSADEVFADGDGLSLPIHKLLPDFDRGSDDDVQDVDVRGADPGELTNVVHDRIMFYRNGFVGRHGLSERFTDEELLAAITGRPEEEARRRHMLELTNLELHAQESSMESIMRNGLAADSLGRVDGGQDLVNDANLSIDISGPDGDGGVELEPDVLAGRAADPVAVWDPERAHWFAGQESEVLRQAVYDHAEALRVDAATRGLRVQEFLDERYGDGDRPWDKYNTNWEDMPEEDKHMFMAEAFMLGHEIPAGEWTITDENGDERKVSMTVTPEVDVRTMGAGTEDEGATMFSGGFERRFYDVETGDYLGSQMSGDYGRTVKEDGKSVKHNFMINDSPILFGGDQGEFFKGPSPTGTGLAKELNYRAYAFYQKIGVEDVRLAAATHGPWVWPRQGFVNLLKKGDKDALGKPIDPAMTKFGRLGSMRPSDLDVGEGISGDQLREMSLALAAPDVERAARYRRLAKLYESGEGISTRDIQLAIEAPTGDASIDSADMAAVSRLMMIDRRSLSGGQSPIKERIAQYEGPVVRVLSASGLQVNGRPFGDWYKDLDAVGQERVVLEVAKGLGDNFRSLGMSEGILRVDDVLPR